MGDEERKAYGRKQVESTSKSSVVFQKRCEQIWVSRSRCTIHEITRRKHEFTQKWFGSCHFVSLQFRAISWIVRYSDPDQIAANFRNKTLDVVDVTSALPGNKFKNSRFLDRIAQHAQIFDLDFKHVTGFQ